MSKKNLYLLFLSLAFTGYAWIILNRFFIHSGIGTPNVCLFRYVTGLPCPSCGTTRSVISIVNGNFRQAFSQNMLGYPATLMLIVMPVWILSDFIRRKNTFYTSYLGFELIMKRRWVAWILLSLVLANWIWILVRIR